MIDRELDTLTDTELARQLDIEVVANLVSKRRLADAHRRKVEEETRGLVFMNRQNEPPTQRALSVPKPYPTPPAARPST